ncbi:hypothetical protein JCM8208_000560 [Rhodotorula glutinis]
MPTRSTRNKQPQPPTAAAPPAPSASDPDHPPSRPRKRKSVAFEDPVGESSAQQPEPEQPQPAPRRSRRTSTATASAASSSTATTSTTSLSAKAAGKRRAVSPSNAVDGPPPPAASSSSAAPKRRKLSHVAIDAPSTNAPSTDSPRTLRTRSSRRTASTSASTSSAAASQQKKTRSSTAAPSSSSKAATLPKPSPDMPRKGTRATRAAKAKARAMEDDDDLSLDAHLADDFSDDEDAGDVGVDVDMDDAPAKKRSASTSSKRKPSVTTAVAEAAPAAPVAEPSVPAASTAADAPRADVVDSEDDEAEAHSDEEDEDSFSEEDGEGDEFDDDDDEEIEEYETSLGLHGEERGEYSDEEDAVDAPRTFNADGDPLASSQALADDEADAEAEAEALFGALAGAAGRSGEGAAGAGAGGGGGALSAFRALQGMMSGMSTRLKGLLTSLKATDGDGTAKLLALQELAELLSISTEDTLAGYFQIEAFSKELVAIVRGDSNGMGKGLGGGGGGGGGGDGAMTVEEAIAFGLDPAEVGAGAGGGGSDDNDEQMMLLACRCLANLMEALPGSAHSVVYAGAVPVLCDKLKDIQYIDLAEQTMSTLEKISEEVPHAIVREGGLSALLTFLDFFSFHVQRTAVTAAANCCRSLSLESFDRVVEVMPIFKNVLGYSDQRVVEQGCLAVVRIVDSYRHYPDKLEQLLTADLLKAVRALLNPDSTTVGVSTYTQSLKMLTTAARASPAVAISLVELDIAHTLYHLLTGVAPPEWSSDDAGKQVLARETTAKDDMLVMQNLVQRPKEQIAEALSCAAELLPALPKDGVFDSRAFTPGKESRSSSRAGKARKDDSATPVAIAVKREQETPDFAAAVSASGSSSSAAATAGASSTSADLAGDVKMEAVDEPVPAVAALRAPAIARTASSTSSRSKRSRDPNKDALAAKRLELVAVDAPAARKLVFQRLVALLLPTLVDVSAASVSPQVRSKAVLGLLKMVHFSEPQPLTEVLNTVPFAAFISAILSSREHQPALITNALQLVELLLVKMPDAYQYTFRREGVMHEIDRLANEELVSAAAISTKSKRSSPARTPRGDEPAAAPATATASNLSRALQSAPAAAAAPTAPALTPVDAQAKDAVTLRARHLRASHGAPDSEPALRAQSVLERIKALVGQLENVAVSGSGSSGAEAMEREAKNALDEIAILFADEKNPLSSFEMVESGLVEGLLKFATEPGSGALTPSKREELIARAFMPQLAGGSATPAFAALVKRLQESLSRLEEFEVVVAAQNANEVDSRRNGTSMLGRQLKLRLIAEDPDIPRSCTNIVVSIHAIATFESFNSYLRPRILAAQAASGSAAGGGAGGGGGGGGGAGTLSSLLAAFAAAAGATDEGDEDTDRAMLSSSPPPRRTDLGDASALAAALAGASSSASGASSSSSAAVASASKPKPASPKRRRSSRLSGKGIETAEEDEAPAPSTSKAVEKPDVDNEIMDEDPCEDDEEALRRENEDLFAGALDAPQQPREDKPVSLEVTGEKVVAKTPDGTRVATPQPAKPADAASSSSRPSPAPTPQKRASYAAALKAEPTDFHLEFSLGGHDVDLDTTVYGAVHRFESQQPAALRRQMWYNVYDVKYRKVEGAARPDEDDANALGDRRRREGSIFSNMPQSIPTGSQQAKILQLLHVLRSVSADFGDVVGAGSFQSAGLADSAFVNSKLTAKLNRQLEEPMIVASACLPDWAVDLAQSFPFLFPFDTRYTFLQSTSFGYARLMQKWVGQTRTDTSRRDENLGFLGRLPRQKVRISRDRILESAYKVFELYGSSRASLEVEFFDEVGSGLGPTLEFYALVSKEFARKTLNLWREGDHADKSDYVHTRTGLFPMPLADSTTDAGKKILKVFRILGQFVAKAMMDTRIIDVNFSRTLMRLVLEQDVPLSIASVTAVDPELGSSLSHLQEYVAAKDEIEADEAASESDRRTKLDAVQVRGATVADLVLDFTLPGRNIELKEGGAEIPVTLDNLAEYIDLVIEWTLKRGIEAQVAEFQRGFSTVFPVRDLQTFTPAELVMMTAAVEEDWTVETLTNSAKADHGFTMDSRPVRDFLSIMADFSAEERREFLSFITGSPRLPIGGFGALSPPLTIVRKDGGDAALPSVMTCVNYVKLPNYSSRAVVRERILMAVREGADGFHLS